MAIDEEWSGLIAHLAGCDRRYRRAVGRLRRTGEGAAEVLAALEALTEAARDCAQVSSSTLSCRHFARQAERCAARIAGLRVEMARPGGGESDDSGPAPCCGVRAGTGGRHAPGR